MAQKTLLFGLKAAHELTFSRSGRLLASVGKNCISIFEVVSREKITESRPFDYPSHIVFSPDETMLAVKDMEGNLCTVDVNTGELRYTVRQEAGEEGCAPLFSPDGKYLIDASWAGNVYAWEVETGECAFHEALSSSMVDDITRDPSTGCYAFAVHTRGDKPDHPNATSRILLWEWPFERGGWRTLPREWETLWVIRYSPDGSKIAVATDDADSGDKVEVVDADTGQVLQSVRRNTLGVGPGLAWSPDGTLLAWAAANEAIVYAVDGLKHMGRLNAPHACDVRFSPDGTLFAVGTVKNGMLLDSEQLGLRIDQ